jgi:predicted transcriptional regulator
MKTATLPSLRVDPELRQAAETVLRKGESLSGFMEQSLRDEVSRRRMQAEFVARGLASRDDSRRTGKYFPADAVHAELRAMLAKTKTKTKTKAKAKAKP